MTLVLWLIGFLASLAMVGVVVALVSDENRRHVTFRRASGLRAWRPRRRRVVVEHRY